MNTNGRRLNNLRHADNVVAMVSNHNDVQQMLTEVQHLLQKLCFLVNENKTQDMTNGAEQKLLTRGNILDYRSTYI